MEQEKIEKERAEKERLLKETKKPLEQTNQQVFTLYDVRQCFDISGDYIEEILTIAIVLRQLEVLLRYYCDSCDTITILLRQL